MAETTTIEVRAEPIDGETSRLTVTGQTEIIAMLMLLVVAALDDEDGGDCGDPDCPVHGEGSDEGDLAETA